MVIRVDSSEAPTYNGDILNEVHITSFNFITEESTDGQNFLPVTVVFDFTFYGKTANGNRLYNKTASQVLDRCTVEKFIEKAAQEAGIGNLDYVTAMQFVEKVVADTISTQKPQYSTASYEEV